MLTWRRTVATNPWALARRQLTKQVNPDGTATLLVGALKYELTTGGAVTATKSTYAVPGAQVIRDASGVYYVLSDHLGSASVTLSAAGGVVGELRYDAFGAAPKAPHFSIPFSSCSKTVAPRYKRKKPQDSRGFLCSSACSEVKCSIQLSYGGVSEAAAIIPKGRFAK